MSIPKEGLQTGHVGREDFVPAPIPTHNVIEGEPVARTCDLSQSRDRGLSMNLWDCTAGRFRWNYGGDELVQILDGEVRVTDEQGRLTVLQGGYTAHFPAGARTEWEVPVYVRKLAIHRSPTSLPARLAQKLRIRAERVLSRPRAHEPVAQKRPAATR